MNEEFDHNPHGLGYRMPAEWLWHEATWLAWPHNRETWPENRFTEIEEIYLRMLEALLPGEKVRLLCHDDKEREHVETMVSARRIRNTNLDIRIAPTVDVWIRDYGPIFVKNREGRKAWCKWRFNAWGGKYPEFIADNHVFEPAKKMIVHPCFCPEMILEGGSIDVNGEGVCLTTECCLLNANRNSLFSRKDIESYLEKYLGVSQTVWLRGGLAGDDTDGHIDNLARFVNADTILAAFEEDASDQNYEPLRSNWEKLGNALPPGNGKWHLIKLPMPGKVKEHGIRKPASYANFYIGNQAVLMPVYGHPNDCRAASILKEHFTGREIVTIPCDALINGLGALHCITQQEPA